MSSSEILKATLISEFEENASINPRTGNKSLHDDVKTLCTEREKLISTFALHKAVEHGIDPRYVMLSQLSSAIPPQIFINKVAFAFSLPDLFEKLVAQINFFDDDAASESGAQVRDAEEGENIPGKDRIQSLALPKDIFSSLITRIRYTRPVLYQAFTQHPLVLNTQKGKRKPYSKHNRKEKDRAEKFKRLSSTRVNKSHDDLSRMDTSSLPTSPTQNEVGKSIVRDDLGVIVAKCIAEETASSYLLTIALLLSVWKDEATQHKRIDLQAETSIPTINLISPFLQAKSCSPNDETVISPLQDYQVGKKLSQSYANTLNQYIVSTPNSTSNPSLSLAGGAKSVSFRNIPTVRTPGSQHNDSTGPSTSFHGAYSDTGSTVESIVTEHGTEMYNESVSGGDGEAEADVDGDGEIDEDISEEEMLAQALALSMNRKDGKPIQSQEDASRSSRSSSVATITTSIRSADIYHQDTASDSAMPTVPKYQVQLLSTFGLLCQPDIWPSSYRADFNSSIFSSAPIRVVIVMLLTVVGSAADDSLSLDSAPVQISYLTHSMRHETKPVSVEPKKADQKAERPEKNSASSKGDASKQDKTATKVLPLLSPEKTSFQLIEFLLDFLVTELRFNNFQSNSSSDSEIACAEGVYQCSHADWLFHRYFLVWSISLVLKILQAELTFVAKSKVNITDIGLVRLNTDNSFVAEPLASVTSVNLRQSMPSRLMSLVADCVGLDPNLTTEHFDCITLALQPKSDEKLKPMAGTISSLLHSAEFYRHELRIRAIEAFVVTTTLMSPKPSDQDVMLLKLLESSPSASDPAIINCMMAVTNKLFDASTFEKATEAIKSTSTSFYMFVLLQKLCSSKLFLDSQWKKNSVTASQNTPLLNSNSKTHAKLLELRNQNRLKIESILIQRLSVFNLQTSSSLAVDGNVSESDAILYHGELKLLHNIQRNYLLECLEIASSTPTLKFNPTRNNRMISLGEENMAMFKSWEKSWATVAAYYRYDSSPDERSEDGMTPMSGIHEWSVKIHNCDQGRVFVGVVTAEASMDTYIGGDSYGWGFIGTRSLWHDKKKIAEFGPNFGTNYTVFLRMNTYTSTLYISTTQTDWIVVKENLPSVVLYPAVSMHHKDDQVSISLRSITVNKNITDSAFISRRKQYKLIAYTQMLCTVVDKLLHQIEGENSATNRENFLSHPFFSVLLPSLIASILNGAADTQINGFFTVQILPFLIVLSKRLSKLYDSMTSQQKQNAQIDINLFGYWNCRSVSVAGPFDYWMILDTTVVNKSENSEPGEEDDDSSNRRAINITKIRGHGKVTKDSTFSVYGTQLGSKYKFCETNDNGRTYVVEGNTSLCGCFIDATYRGKSGSGTLSCSKSPLMVKSIFMQDKTQSNLNVSTLVVKYLAMLCSLACGKLSSYLITGVEQLSSNEGISSETFDSYDAGDNFEMQISQPTKIEELALPQNDWTNAELFSGGLPHTPELLKSLMPDFAYLVDASTEFNDTTKDRILCTPPADLMYPDFEYTNLVSWWVAKVFPQIQPYLDSAATFSSVSGKSFPDRLSMSPADDMDIDLKSFAQRKFVDHVIENSEEFRRLDHYVSQHIGQLSMKKVGGEALAEARRVIFASVIRHSGCDCICVNEAAALITDQKALTDRPQAVLKDIWRAVQRIIDVIIKLKQTTGGNFAAVSQKFKQKAEFLLSVEPNKISKNIAEYLLSSCLCSESNSDFIAGFSSDQFCSGNFVNSSEVEATLHQDSIKQLNDIVKFLISPSDSIKPLQTSMLAMAFKTISRIAGFKSIMLLFQKQDDLPKNIPNLPVLASISMQPAALEYLIASLYSGGYTSMTIQDPSDPTSVEESNSDTIMDGHYTAGLKAVNTVLLTDLTRSFENLYEFIAQLLSRSTWGGIRSVQCTALACWGITISVEDHFFLNRIGIFRILQSVLEDARASSNRITSLISSIVAKTKHLSLGNSPPSKSNINLDTFATYATEMLVSQDKQLAFLVIKIVHSLASQVAYSIDSKKLDSFRLPTNRLQRMPSGPDTLSQSLFEMLYAELFFGLKNILSSSISMPAGSKSQIEESTPLLLYRAASNAQSEEDDKKQGVDGQLKGNEYIYRVLRLLSSVASSSICQKCITSPKWITLLLMVVGCGNLIVQRRLFRLLRTLVISIPPRNFKAYVPRFEVLHSEIEGAEAPFDEEEVASWTPSEPNVSSYAVKLIEFLLDGITIAFPTTQSTTKLTASIIENEAVSTNNLVRKLHEQGILTFISGECLFTLRRLQSIPSWKDIIDTVFDIRLNDGSELLNQLLKDSSSFNISTVSSQRKVAQKTAAVLGVLGGNAERVRLGGIVRVRPVHPTESLAVKISSASRSGFVVSKAPSSLEMILIEKSSYVDSIDIVSQIFSAPQDSDGYVPVNPLTLVRLSTSDVIADSIIPFNDEHISIKTFDHLLTALSNATESMICRLDENVIKPQPTTTVATAGTQVEEKSESGMEVDEEENDDNDQDDDENDDNVDDHDDADDKYMRDDEKHDYHNREDSSQSSPSLSMAAVNEITSDKTIEYFLNTTVFRSVYSSLRNDMLADMLLKKYSSLISRLLQLSLYLPKNGIDCSTEQIEEKWSAVWEELCVFDYGGPSSDEKDDDHERKLPPPKASEYAAPRLGLSRGASDTAPSTGGLPRSLARGSSILESAARAGLLPYGSSVLSRAPPAAELAAMISQMTDMGLPKEWADAALRRCRYNVEMAINMCFESGIDMSLIVAEETARASAEASAPSNPGGYNGPGVHSGSTSSLRSTTEARLLGRIFSREDSSPGDVSSSLSFLSQTLLGLRPQSAASGATEDRMAERYRIRAALASRNPEPEVGSAPTTANASETDDRIQQLSDMGFPQHWCRIALQNTNGNVDSALAWIFSHGDELIADNTATATVTSDKNQAEVDDDDEEPTVIPRYNPVSTISGACEVRNDLKCICSPSHGNFPSVGCRGFGAANGKWYYEVTLETAGCIQIGWADASFKGSAENGQGVGDDLHSWAFDGWRVHTWHEISLDWGAKWKIGDVVGCAIDIDNRIISYFLNGFGDEIGMGVAFEDFEFSELLYPCLSFNNQETVRFNLGSNKFKYEPPLGYLPFSQHIEFCLSEVKSYIHTLRDPSLRKYLAINCVDAEEITDFSNMFSNHKKAPIYLENALEELSEEKEHVASQRYFPPEQRAVQSSTDSTTSILHGQRTKMSLHFAQLSCDLVIRYSRSILFRLIYTLPQIIDQSGAIMIQRLLSSVNSIPLPTEFSPTSNYFDVFIRLIRLHSATSNRSRLYLQVLKSNTLSAQNANFGSLFMLNGAPFLNHMTCGFRQLIRTNNKGISHEIVDKLIDQVGIDSVNVLRRDLTSEWLNEGCMVPFVSKLGSLTERQVVAYPSLLLAMWITFILMENFIAEFNRIQIQISVENSDWYVVGKWIENLCRHWCLMLRSPNQFVKHCAMQVLSCILQEVHLNGHVFRNYELPQAIASSIYDCIPLRRLKQLTRRLVASEQRYMPIVSEYLQTMLELCLATEQLSNIIDSVRTSPSKVETFVEQVTAGENSSSVSNYNWEVVSGHLLSESSVDWKVWTGHVTPDIFFEVAESRSSRRQESYPPPLLPGGRVSRPYPQPDKNDSPMDIVVDSTPSNGQDEDAPPPSKRVVREGSIDLDQTSDSSSNPSKSERPKDASKIQRGTVVAIAQWDDKATSGSARLIKWDDEEAIEKVRWGAERIFDVSHIKFDVPGVKIENYPHPTLAIPKLINNDKGDNCSFAVLLRYRELPNDTSNMFTTSKLGSKKIAGVLEWPEFLATVFVTGHISVDGSWTITEQHLLSGSKYQHWLVRFGRACWSSGTTYHLSRSTEEPGCTDATDDRNAAMVGSYDQLVWIDGKDISISGQIRVQCSRLFHFDPIAHAPSISISLDKRTVAKSSQSNAQVCAFGTIGFSSGVHYWEFKIETADTGSVYVGVAERASNPGASKTILGEKCSRWTGYGYLNNRASFRSRVSNVTDNLSTYGDHFQNGDIVGVLLDMNRGRLTFFLDGIKYGEHKIENLGEAFDGLTTPNSVNKRTLYPVVGIQRPQDRVTITPRWLSTFGVNAHLEYELISRAWKLLTHWSIVRPSSRPMDQDLWIYRAAWRDWLSWQTGRFISIESRFNVPGVKLVLDVNPISFVEASIRLGLPKALFRGDRIQFFKSSGRSLETKEEGVIIGTYNGQLWYRMDSNQRTTALSDTGLPAWFLTPNDIDGIIVLPRAGLVSTAIPEAIADIYLPRIPQFRGGLLMLSHDGEAVMRNGIEIDNSEKICTIPSKSVVFALERRVNASNIARYKIIFNGNCGWISERMRGSTEDLMLVRHSTATIEDIATATQAAIAEATAQGIDFPFVWSEVDSFDDAMTVWEGRVKLLGYESLLSSWNAQLDLINAGHEVVGKTFEDYLLLATTTQPNSHPICHNWSVEEDMQLSELLAKTAVKEGVQPQNLSMEALRRSLLSLEANSCALNGVDIDHALARAAILRVANRVIGHALPYINTTLPEEHWRTQCVGHSTDIEIVQTVIPPSPLPLAKNSTYDKFQSDRVTKFSWQPPCTARRIRSFRRLLFNQTKLEYWESVLEATQTHTPLHQDEYEDPPEIPTISINRIKAVPVRLSAISSIQDRVKQTVFGQLKDSIDNLKKRSDSTSRRWNDASFRRSYLGKGHGGQKRAFKVKFMGEGVNDYGGPYRAVFEQIADEMQGEMIAASVTNQCILPLLVPCANRSASVGANQDKFLFSPAKTTPLSLDLMNFFGKILGTSSRHNLSLGLDLSALVWRPLVGLPVSRAHLETVDTLAVKTLESITEVGIGIEKEDAAKPLVSRRDSTFVPEDWVDLNFTVHLPNGARVSLLPGGESMPVNLGNWRSYVELTEKYRLRESLHMFRAFRDGLGTVLPLELLPLFTAAEIEQLLTGTRKVDISLLQKCTEYEGVDPNSPHIKFFWEVVEEMSAEEVTSLLRFVWARSRMPSSSQHVSINFKLQGPQGDAKERPDEFLPHAQTCFFSLSLPAYSSKEILRNKLLYAVNNSPNMDADVRLHSAEGWADS